MMAKLIITINLDIRLRPTAEELALVGYKSEAEFWYEGAFANSEAPDLFTGSTWDLFEECGETRQRRRDWPARGPCDLRIGHNGMHHSLDKKGNGIWWT